MLGKETILLVRRGGLTGTVGGIGQRKKKTKKKKDAPKGRLCRLRAAGSWVALLLILFWADGVLLILAYYP